MTLDPADLRRLIVETIREALAESGATLAPLLSQDAATEILGVSRRTVFSYVQAGKLKAVKLGARTLFDPADIRAFIEAHKHEGSAT